MRNVDQEYVRLNDSVLWVNQSYEMDNGQHHHISPYLIEAPEGYVLIESGSIEHQDVLLERLDSIVGDSGISAAILSHYDLPHVANARVFRDKWDFNLYTSFSGGSTTPESLGMGKSIKCTHGESMKIAGEQFNFPWPPLVDAGHSMWVYHETSKTLFVADMGHYHRPGEGSILWNEKEHRVTSMTDYMNDALPFTKYLDTAKMQDAFNILLNEYEVEYLAPVHGNPVAGSDEVSKYMDYYIKAIGKVHEEAWST